MTSHDAPRMVPRSERTNPLAGVVVWSPAKSLWFGAHAAILLAADAWTLDLRVMALTVAATVTTLCLGHSVGLHRLLVHRSFAAPRWVEYLLVHLGTVVGMQGPLRILYMHDIRDWAQRHPACHPYFIHRNPLWKDGIWQLFCELRLDDPPRLEIEERVAADPVYRWMQRTWMLQSIPWAVLFYWLAGWGGVVWATCGRIAVSLIGHWLIGYFAHNTGTRDWHLEGHAVQGHNLPYLGLLTMGESWHNNHHAFPGSARLGIRDSQFDPGWWAIRTLERLGLAWEVRLPSDLPPRPERISLESAPVVAALPRPIT